MLQQQAPHDRATDRNSLDAVAIEQLIRRERRARDMHEWDALAGCYTADSMIEMSWFKGSGIAFADASRKVAAGGLFTFHEPGPSFVEIAGDRALADTGMAAHVIREIGGAEADVTFYTRMRSRAERRSGRWLLAGYRIIYIHDLIVPRNPSRIPQIDSRDLAQFRPTYRYLSYALSISGHPIANDLPGVDRPDTVRALIAADQSWLSDEN